MKKVLFLITTLGGGGAERVMSYIIDTLSSDKKYQITLLLLKNDGHSYLDAIPKNVNIEYLGIKGRIRHSVFKIVRAILRLKPNICFCGLDKLNILLAPFLPIFKLFGIKTIVRETNVLSCQYNNRNIFIRFLYKKFYNLYNIVVAQSDDMRDDLKKNWGIIPNKIIKINNPVDIKKIEIKSHEESKFVKRTDRLNLVMIGRLTFQKGYDIIFQRLSEIDHSVQFHLYILGVGEAEDSLKKQVEFLNLSDKVTFCGYTQNPYCELKQSDGLILSSRFEGFPNVLLEANALGKRVFVNNCPGGINEIVVNEENGLVCNFEDRDDFLNSFFKFLYTQYSSRDIKRLTEERYSLSSIMQKYEQIFESLSDR